MSQLPPTGLVACPVCHLHYHKDRIEQHVNDCLTIMEVSAPGSPCFKKRNPPVLKRSSDRVAYPDLMEEQESGDPKKCKTEDVLQPLDLNEANAISPFFARKQPKQKVETLSRPPKTSSISPPQSQEESHTLGDTLPSPVSEPSVSPIKSLINVLSAGVPLADRMRPKRLDDYIGQEQAIGQNIVMHSLLQNNYIPSMILWGPPGCGKVM